MEAQTEELQTTTEELAERTAVAEAAVDRTERLQALTAALAAVDSAGDVAAVVVAHAWTAVGASAAGVFLRVRGTDEAQTVRFSGADEETLERYRRIPSTRAGRPRSASAPASRCSCSGARAGRAARPLPGASGALGRGSGTAGAGDGSARRRGERSPAR